MNLENIRILVLGDIMLDKYVVGDVDRISPEAPVPIVKVTDEYCTLGGCGNVVRNIREIGVEVDCAASITSDYAGGKIVELLDAIGAGNLLVHQSDVTTVKERIIADQRKIQMIRIDREVTHPINPTPIIEEIRSSNKRYDVTVVSDYAKGVISYELMQYLDQLYDCPVIVDPKPQNKFYYGKPFMITPNTRECEQMGGANHLLTSGIKYVLETKGRKGMTLYDCNESWEIPAIPVEVYNVSGAGDTVIAIMAICLANGLNPRDAAIVANKCAGYVVTQTGTSTVPKDFFLKCLEVKNKI